MSSHSGITGKPVWIDLSTHDIEGAQHFYGELFGWSFEDQGEEFGHYHMVKHGESLIGGAMSSLIGPEGPLDEPVNPTIWSVYLGTDDVAAASQRVTESGGTVVVDPMQIGELGSMAVAVDPAGAMIGLWESDTVEGASTMSEPGLPCWFEVMSSDFDAAKPFYETVFGWEPNFTLEDGSESREAPESGFRYATNFSRDRVSAGLCDAAEFVQESYWRVYVLVDDVDKAAKQVAELGGSVLDGPQDSPFGRLYTISDPQGAQLQILSGGN
ncbi:VOC family protein [Corynebacterium lubricantis]|uniref:VOC family protein n=1 Tax=Corynebacterium lubricantis TaxID=541095 RepID=UPI0003644B36|nr:VOC family protein [Corynebacterium lubricantis]